MALRVSYSLPDPPQRDDRPAIVLSLVRKRTSNDVRRLRMRLVDAADYLAPLDADDVASANADVSAAGRVNASAD